MAVIQIDTNVDKFRRKTRKTAEIREERAERSAGSSTVVPRRVYHSGVRSFVAWAAQKFRVFHGWLTLAREPHLRA